MIVLAIETCIEPGSLALLREGGPPEVAPLPGGWHSTTLHSHILRLLAGHGLSVHDVAGYGVTTGPGAFTAVRVGLTAVKALAEVQEKPVVPVSTLELIAAAGIAADAAKPHAVLVPILDARRGQVFGAAYRAGEDGFRLLLPETVSSLSALLEQVRTLASNDVLLCGTDPDRFAPEIEKAGWEQGTLIRVSPCLAGVLATIAAARLRQGFGVAALSVDANYVRASDAELFWKG